MRRHQRIATRALVKTALLIAAANALAMSGGTPWAEISAAVPEASRDPSLAGPVLNSVKEVLLNARADNDAIGLAMASFVVGEILEQNQVYQEALQYYESGLQVLADSDTVVAIDVDFLLQRIQGFEKRFSGPAQMPGSADLYRGRANSGQIASLSKAAASQHLATALAVNVGNLYLRQMQLQPAAEYFMAAVSSAKQSGDISAEAEAYSNLAWTSITGGDFESATLHLREAMELGGNNGVREPLRKATLAIGVNARESGQVEAAIENLTKAVGLYNDVGDEVGVGRARAHLGTALLLAEQLHSAKDAYLAALLIGRETGDEETIQHSRGGLARTYQKLGDWPSSAAAFAGYFDALDEFVSAWRTDQGRVAIFESQQAMLDDYATVESEIAMQSGDFSRLHAVIQKVRGRALACLLQSKQNRIVRPAGMLDGGTVFYGKNWDYIQREYAHAIGTDAAMSMMEQRAPAVAVGTTTTADAVTDHCGIQTGFAERTHSGPPILEYYVAPDRLVILLTDERGIHGQIIDIGASDLRTRVNRYLEAIQVDQPRGVVAAGTAATTQAQAGDVQAAIARQLYDQLIRPVETHLRQSTHKSIVIIPDESLWRLPFAALLDREDRYFGDRFESGYITSQTALSMLRSRQRHADHNSVRAWVVGNPTLPNAVNGCGERFELSNLPNAEAEATEVAEILGENNVDLFVGGAADRLRLDAWHSDYSVLHLATHGIACPSDPLSSFVALTALDSTTLKIPPDNTIAENVVDSRLPVQLNFDFDLEQVDAEPSPSYPGVLQARHVINEYNLQADLVTLSACQSGLGQVSGDGTIGFARAFLAAGARSVIVSLWKVDDHATRLLMTQFYKGYAEHGNKARALQNAMTATRAIYQDPQYWAGFVLIGMQE